MTRQLINGLTLEEMRAVVEAVSEHEVKEISPHDGSNYSLHIVSIGDVGTRREFMESVATFIHAMNRPTILALLDALEDARGREKDLERIFDSERQARADDRRNN